MSQHNTRPKHLLFGAICLTSTILSSAAPVWAQSNTNSRFAYTAPLSSLALGDTDNASQTLDWRKSTHNFNFELPEFNLTDNIELLLSANPIGPVNPRTPLSVQFNNDTPVLLNVDGQGFDARITLDPNKARTSRNIIKISYATENEGQCLNPQDGTWDIDLAQSKLVINSRASSRALQLREIETLLDSPGLAPKSVNLVASGENAVQLQALAAQGIGLRMDNLPDFTTTRQNSDFQIIMARRSELGQYVNDKSLIKGRNAAIIVTRARPVQLIFTGDTDAQVLSVVKSFAERSLPPARRSMTSFGETRLQSPFKSKLVRLTSTQALSNIPGASTFANWRGDDWAREVKSLRFDVTDPAAMSGEVVLRLASSADVSDTSKLRVQLNGQNIGTTTIDKRRKTVGFKIKAGALRGKNNVLTLLPELTPKDLTVQDCAASSKPNFHLGGGSKIIINSTAPSPITELSRMGATAAPFSDDKGAGSYIAMPGSVSEFNASLKVMARLAKTSGEGLTGAAYSRSLNLNEVSTRHVLYIGPLNRVNDELVQNAPRALTGALRGQVFDGDNLISARPQQFASLNADQAFRQAARSLSQSRRVSAGGVAALYPSQLSSAHVIGVITNTPGQNYTTSANMISQELYWSQIKGGVARWDSDTVLSAQAPQAVPGYRLPRSTETSKAFRLGLDTDIFDGAINGASDLSAKMWEGLRGFSLKLTGRDSAPETAKAAPVASLPAIATPDRQNTRSSIPSPALKPLKRAVLDGLDDMDGNKAALENKASPESLKILAVGTLSRANDWTQAKSQAVSAKFADFDMANIDMASAISNLQTRTHAAGQNIRTLFEPNPVAVQNLKRNLQNPAALLVLAAFILALLGLLFSTSGAKNRR